MNKLDSFMNFTELADDEDLDIASIFGKPSLATLFSTQTIPTSALSVE